MDAEITRAETTERARLLRVRSHTLTDLADRNELRVVAD